MTAARKLSFTVTGHPVTWNLFYAGVHWSRRKRLADRWRWAVLATVREVTDARPVAVVTPARLSVVVHYERGKRFDLDNVWLKPLLDVLVQEGIIPDDNVDHIREIHLSAIPAAHPALTVTLETITEHRQPLDKPPEIQYNRTEP